MDTLTHTEEMDLSLVKAQAARNYARKRRLLRLAVKMGIFEAHEVRARRAEVIECKTTWRAARSLLKGNKS